MDNELQEHAVLAVVFLLNDGFQLAINNPDVMKKGFFDSPTLCKQDKC